MKQEDVQKLIDDIIELSKDFEKNKRLLNRINKCLSSPFRSFKTRNGEEIKYFSETTALGQLLLDGNIFLTESKLDKPSYLDHIERDIYGLTPEVNCNDLFYWGTADSEIIESIEELKDLYLKSEKNKGYTKWSCFHRGESPQKSIIKDMKEKGLWDEEWQERFGNQE